jgi:hypothetical protein
VTVLIEPSATPYLNWNERAPANALPIFEGVITVAVERLVAAHAKAFPAEEAWDDMYDSALSALLRSLSAAQVAGGLAWMHHEIYSQFAARLAAEQYLVPSRS